MHLDIRFFGGALYDAGGEDTANINYVRIINLFGRVY